MGPGLSGSTEMHRQGGRQLPSAPCAPTFHHYSASPAALADLPGFSAAFSFLVLGSAPCLPPGPLSVCGTPMLAFAWAPPLSLPS